ncbi:hypothetical protein PCC9214_04797 [Planktothrix tepida]|uniref:Uncharacterized protein n=2 Tax=Planktothrix TaxID=54304 RepID=A0A1J1LPE7_9CYAN|nr:MULTISPECIES: hypothetical protein [Planktothrix]CAD5920905.1 hypothetical protein NO713_00656 [Planktothrix pseudagardhii]CAD5981406.1 hypothetical protein PCC9214_04797 [Planktothrix tepida]CUR33788.1 conserved hypothetical protein [Planktothrix tepida PCC 9214]
MPSLEVREFAEKINQLSLEDKQWLLQQLSLQLNSQGLEIEKLNQKKQAREIISETLLEVLSMSDNCYDKVWGRFDAVCTKICQENLE